MRTKINFETSNDNFSRVIGNNIRYEVPPYQRDYSWQEEQWGDLWDDITELYDTPENDQEEHYMGYLVLQKQDTNLFTIIDGQQRITTISLLVLAILQILKASHDEQDQERLKIYENDYIRKKYGSSLQYQHKLKLNRNNDYYYRNHLANLADQPARRNLKRSEHFMRQAKKFFEEKLKARRMSGNQLGNFIETFANYLLFTVITVGDENNAYKIFETLNARGVQLSTPDLLKNYLFSILDPHFQNPNLITEQEEKWGAILNHLKQNEFSKFLQTLWNSKNNLVTKNQLFKKIKNNIDSSKKALDFLEVLEKKSEIYTALQDFQDDYWNNYSTEVKECLYVLKIFSIVKPYSILLASQEKHTKPGFEKICKHLLAFVVRYHAVCHKPAKEIERVYNQIAVAIDKGKNVADIKKIIFDFYPDDEEFKNDFCYLTIQTNKKSNYFLSKIESHLNPSNPISFQNDYTVEHILPKKSVKNDDYWQEQFNNLLEQSIQRLGNLTLLTSKDNKAVNCDNFEQKKKMFENSTLKMIQKIMQYNDWNPDSLAMYQQFLADNACEIWKINFEHEDNEHSKPALS